MTNNQKREQLNNLIYSLEKASDWTGVDVSEQINSYKELLQSLPPYVSTFKVGSECRNVVLK